MSDPEPLLAADAVEALAERWDFSYENVSFSSKQEVQLFRVGSGPFAGQLYELRLRKVDTDGKDSE